MNVKKDIDKQVLIINASARTVRSQSRKLAETFKELWQSHTRNTVIQLRDLGLENVPHINEIWISAAFKPLEDRTYEEVEALKMSDEYIAELKEADIIVIASPMYNWSIPSSLKAYIDQVVRVNQTWRYNPDNIQDPYIGLLENKEVVLLLTRGSQGYEIGNYNEQIDFQTNYLKRVCNVMGITKITVVTLDGEANDKLEYSDNITEAHKKVRTYIETIFS